MESGTWRCDVCGYVHCGLAPPSPCPVCGAPVESRTPVLQLSALAAAFPWAASRLRGRT